MAISNNSKPIEKPTKWEQVYEDEETISIWKYNSKITTAGPVEVETKYKRGYSAPKPVKKKTLGDLVKDDKKVVKQEVKLKKTKSRFDN
jgi:hypothetical protein